MQLRRVLYITHADVRIDPAVPVPDWGLSERGRARHAAFNTLGPVERIGAVYCSDERKAMDGATILANARGLSPVVDPRLGENDRSATGYLPEAEFQATADAFFAQPAQSVRGWERAIDAQNRVVSAVDALIAREAAAPRDAPADLAIVGHGGVGALLLCRLSGGTISRDWEQPGGPDGAKGGCFFVFDADGGVVQGWRPIDG